MLSYPSGMTISSRALNLLSDLLRGRPSERGTRWRKLPAGRQALLVVAHLRKNEAYAELACGFGIGTRLCTATSAKASTCSPRGHRLSSRRSRSLDRRRS